VAQFVDAGHRSIVAEAPFFFAAGFATAPPRGPFGYARGEQQPLGDAPPFAFVRGSILSATPPPAPPVGNHASLTTPPVDGSAPFAFFSAGAPKVLTFRPTGRAFGIAQPAESAPWTWSTRFLPTASIVPQRPVGSSFIALGRQYYDDLPPYAYARGLPANATIPPTTAEILSAAIYRIVNANLTVQVPLIYEASATIPPGYVIATIPPSGTQLPIWASVQIIVSSGPAYPPGTILPPNVLGKTAQDARDAIFSAGLSLDQNLWVVSPITAGFVVAQSLPPTTPVLPGTLIQLTLSLGPTKPPVPTPPIPPPLS
jgi:PASTA domain